MLDCYRTCKKTPDAELLPSQVVAALTYFNLPIATWPLGAQLHQRIVDQDTKAAAAASQIVAAVKYNLSNAFDVAVFAALEESKTKAVMQQTRWRFQILKEQGAYSVMVGSRSQSMPCIISPIMRTALKDEFARELMTIHYDSNWDKTGIFEITMKA